MAYVTSMYHSSLNLHMLKLGWNVGLINLKKQEIWIRYCKIKPKMVERNGDLQIFVKPVKC